ncbi:MAG: response regulator [Alphaproteobacteria bacterium]|jgi:two-component system phosphate regulon response regulator PhoB|nr:response regulator [Alphaproteobacteria bacterium]MBP9877531.1 response regulator [Alphaproteobacteria bacterium]
MTHLAEPSSKQKLGTILIIEDEEDLRILLQYNLEQKGYTVLLAADGQVGFEKLIKSHPDLIILDWMLPTESGIEICRHIRKNAPTLLQKIPILMLTARAAETDKITGLDIGVDDYMTKPFSIKELLSRIHALLRRSNDFQEKQNILTYKDISLNLEQGLVLRDQTLLKLSTSEFRLISLFISNQGKIFTRDELIDHLWGLDHAIEPRTIDVHIKRLRAILNDQKEQTIIRTVRGQGYVMG